MTFGGRFPLFACSCDFSVAFNVELVKIGTFWEYFWAVN